VLLIGERSFRLALSEYVAHYHAEHNHQGKDNVRFLVTRKRDEAGLCNVAKGWAGCCIIIIKKPSNLAEKSRMILWLEVDPAQGQLCWWQTSRCHRTLLSRSTGKANEGLGNNQRASIPSKY
jgi:hypothetical protein